MVHLFKTEKNPETRYEMYINAGRIYDALIGSSFNPDTPTLRRKTLRDLINQVYGHNSVEEEDFAVFLKEENLTNYELMSVLDTQIMYLEEKARTTALEYWRKMLYWYAKA